MDSTKQNSVVNENADAKITEVLAQRKIMRELKDLAHRKARERKMMLDGQIDRAFNYITSELAMKSEFMISKRWDVLDYEYGCLKLRKMFEEYGFVVRYYDYDRYEGAEGPLRTIQISPPGLVRIVAGAVEFFSEQRQKEYEKEMIGALTL